MKITRGHTYAIWAAILVPMWIVLVLCTHWEPVSRDGWGHFLYQKNIGLSLHSLYDFAKGTYVHNNPRLGQVLTLLVYTPGPWHSIVTPLVEIGMFYLLTTLVLGRWPSLRRTDDALLFATITAMTAVTAPVFGPMLFYRPFTGNYLFGLVINLVFLLPYRFSFESTRRFGWWFAPIMLVAGFASGLCNEHTGPAIVALAAAATIACWRRGERLGVWSFAGIAGMIAGGLALFYAPGQSIRYNALATQGSMLHRIVDRGLASNGRIFGVMCLYMLPALVWVILALIARTRGTREPMTSPQRWSMIALGAGAFGIVTTLLLSPKLGPRLYLGSVTLACAAISGWVVAELATQWARIVAAALAAGIFLFVGWKFVTAYHEVGPEFAARLEALQHAPPNSVLELPRYTVKRSRWVFDDDLEIEQTRNMVSYSFGLALIKLTGPGPTTPPPEEP